MGLIAFHGRNLVGIGISYLTKSSGSAFLIIFRVDVPWSIENWLSLGTHSFLYGFGRFSYYKVDLIGSWCLISLNLFSSLDSAFRFDFACTSAFSICINFLAFFAFQFTLLVIFCSVHGTHTFLNKFFRVIILRNLWTHSFRIDLSMWGFFWDHYLFFKIILMSLSFFWFRFLFRPSSLLQNVFSHLIL